MSLSGDGSTALIGANAATVGANPYEGVAYIFVVSDRNLIQQQKLTASDSVNGDSFGLSVTLNSDGSTALIAAVGAPADGAVYVFVNNGGNWSQQQKLTASDGAYGDRFGYSVSLSADGNTALIGAWGATVGGNEGQGAAYLFVNSGGTWSQQQKLTSSDGAEGDGFGVSVSLSGDGNTALIGALNATVGANDSQGAAYVQQAQSGSLTVTISPHGAVFAGAMWSVDGGVWQASGSTVSNLSVGQHTVAFSGVQGWTTPPSQRVTITSAQATYTTGTYATPGSLSVTINPPGAASAGATWNVDGGATSYASGAVVPDLSAGSHSVAFSGVQGWTAPPSQTVTITKGKSLPQ